MSRTLKARLSALERQHLQPSAGPHDMAEADRWRAIAESVRIVLRSHAWPCGLAELLQRMEAGAGTEEDAQLGERIAVALKGTDLTAVDLVRQVFDVEASV